MHVGIIGCGNISGIYAKNSALFKDIDFVACADIDAAAAAETATTYSLSAMSVDDLLASKDIDIVLNLTIPIVHAAVSRAAIGAGKHVYSEKPLATTLEDGIDLIARAKAKGVRVGCAPDTILGAGLQTAKAKLDAGEIGPVVTGLAAVMSKGMEHWHPNPGFFYQKGAGPVLDLGPYYISALVALLGPVATVRATGQISPVERRYGGEGPNKGKVFPVDTFTTVNAVLSFANGANISFIASWDVWRHGVKPIELHGTLASLRVPDPDTFGGDVETFGGQLPPNMHDPDQAEKARAEWTVTRTDDKQFGGINYPFENPAVANYRCLGLAEMANAIGENRPHRCNGDFALHVLAVMLGILEAADTDRTVRIEQTCQAPAALNQGEAAGLLR
jgi:predicted dehydrogenase